MPVSAEQFRAVFGSFPTAVSIVTTVDPGGEPKGFTCNAVSAVSADPPLLLVCVDKRSRTLPALASSGAFVLHMLADGGQDNARLFASRAEQKFTGVRWRPSAVADGAPVLLDGVLARAECVVVQQVEAGDHWILIARVDGAAVPADTPVLYHRGIFETWRSPARSVRAPAGPTAD
ncbi:flavin reductase family protein [Streptomyces boncukensis]|uniref:Flavin reductase family protein n=1 Tax=Streptomyces boncukensis TaxID=2711219 RepID=A0A6G4WYA6_9ACTN|nr:flavin reductase family protein [Streptomyces boncukensis]NGO70279.1 flavin reductase family protein [Streptomyces boncukensis]